MLKTLLVRRLPINVIDTTLILPNFNYISLYLSRTTSLKEQNLFACFDKVLWKTEYLVKG